MTRVTLRPRGNSPIKSRRGWAGECDASRAEQLGVQEATAARGLPLRISRDSASLVSSEEETLAAADMPTNAQSRVGGRDRHQYDRPRRFAWCPPVRKSFTKKSA
eukprot:CAMPEP_0181353044 /NCGR_PEP_ID=MMETSP1106-20121128/2628_1 /TAXON_ID=81844 /ORGANISM="Mantoniella antarctica, Strain SL-175" /LENGTH=104 /DNA_ID=CAMNT_0023465635 /DNA_START=137 /DNA_END=452 /DNA_ORIENTATION=-